MDITFDTNLRTPNKFKKNLWDDLKEYGVMLRGYFVLTSLKIDEFNRFCENHGYHITNYDITQDRVEENRHVTAYYDRPHFYIHFYSRYDPPITQTEKWDQISNKDPNRRGYVFHYYLFLLAIEYLKSEGFIIDYSDDLHFLSQPREFNEIEKPEKIGQWEIMDHQIEGSDQIVEWGGKGIVGDEAGLGKTLTGIEVIRKLFDDMEWKRGIWVVPRVPLIYQVVEEIRDRYGIHAFPITQKLSKKERVGEGDEPSIYEKEPFCVMTWATFRNDFVKNLEKVWDVKFGFAIFDEVHVCKYGNKAFDAVLNFPSNVRIGLTGTPSTNGRWSEFHNIIYAINPLSVSHIYKYYDKERKLEKKFEKFPQNGESPEKTASRIMNKTTNTALSRKIIRHERKDLMSQLPEINEIDPIHTNLNGTEDLIVEILFDILESTIDEWFSDRTNYTIKFAKSMIWQDLRRFCSYGGKNFKTRIKDLLTEKKDVYRFIQKRFKSQLIRIDKELQRHPIKKYPKFPILLHHLSKIPSHHVLIFCNSVMTCIDMAEYCVENDIECRVVTGSININDLIENVPKSEQDQEKERIDTIFKHIHQRGSMSDTEVQNVLEWFWSPYVQISDLPDKLSHSQVLYSIDGNEWVEYCYYVNLKKAQNIKIKIDNSDNIARDEKRYVNNMIKEIKTIDPNYSELIGENTITYSFVNKDPAHKKLLITTNKLSEGCNLQIAQSVIFFDQPLSIKEREQRLARIHRIGSPYDQIYLLSIICGIEYAIMRTLEEKYDSTGSIKFSESKNVSLSEIARNVRKINRILKKSQPKKHQSLDGFL